MNDKIDNALRINMLKDMLTIRYFELKVKELDMQGELPGFFHLYIGEEACAVGACSAINRDDYITSTHRGHGHLLAKGGEPRYAMAELFAKETGYNHGKGGSMHIAAPELGMLGANGIVGAGIPIATGAALSAKLQKNGRVALSFFGDGAANQGTFHEAINIGSVFNLPIVYICENNMYAVGTNIYKTAKITDIAKRAQGYGIPGITIDGNDPDIVYAIVKEAVDKARSGGGPSLIECKTYRHLTHFTGEPDTYRPKDELDDWIAKDPLVIYPRKLTDEGVIADSEYENMRQCAKQTIEEAVAFAKKSPKPALDSVLTDVYAK